jgi:dipeptidyl-peptidase-3
MENHGLEPEKTRVRKSKDGNKIVYDILQASAQTNTMLETRLKGSAIHTKVLQHNGGSQHLTDATIQVVRGDHSQEMSNICDHLTKAIRFSANKTQTRYFMNYLESFTTGSLEAYRRSMKHWVKDYNPRVESIFGFFEPYRDPYGVRREWRGVVSIADSVETAKLATLVNSSTKFIQTLPWAVSNVNNGKGPFEKVEF